MHQLRPSQVLGTGQPAYRRTCDTSNCKHSSHPAKRPAGQPPWTSTATKPGVQLTHPVPLRPGRGLPSWHWPAWLWSSPDVARCCDQVHLPLGLCALGSWRVALGNRYLQEATSQHPPIIQGANLPSMRSPACMVSKKNAAVEMCWPNEP